MCKNVNNGRPRKSNKLSDVERAKKHRAKNLDLICIKEREMPEKN